MSITELTQEYEIQTSADQDNEDIDREGTGDLTVPRINNNKRPLAIVGEHCEHGDKDSVPQPPKRFQTSSSRSASEFHWNLEDEMLS